MTLAVQACEELLRHCHGQRRTTWLLWKDGVTPSVINSLFNSVRSINSGRGNALAATGEWHRKAAKDWFCDASWKFPKVDGSTV
jgi:hypothetical protein